MSSELFSKLREGDIIPSVIPTSQSTSIKGGLILHFATAKGGAGEMIERAATLSQPDVEFKEADPSATYTLIMTDPDLLAKNDKLSGQVRHWIKSGVSFDEASGFRPKANLNPAVLNAYVPPSPAYGTGAHRYVFIVAKEPAGYTPSLNVEKWGPLSKPDADLKDRLKFDAAAYALEEKLTIEGVGWMEVAADAAAMKDNLALTAEAIKNKLTGQ